MDRRKDAQKKGVEELLPNNRRRMQTKDMTMNHILEQLIRAVQIRPLNVDAEKAAALIGISPAHFYAQLAQGLIPPGTRMGRRRLWSVCELQCWILAGMPNAERWAVIRTDVMKSLN
jgi:predicted DNA-binding transcriptional regulator AlpA